MIQLILQSRKRLTDLENMYVPCVPSCFSPVRLFATPWTVTHQAPLSIGFSRQEPWSGLPCPPAGDLPDTGIESVTSCSSSFAGEFFTSEPPGKPPGDVHTAAFKIAHKDLLCSTWNSA